MTGVVLGQRAKLALIESDRLGARSIRMLSNWHIMSANREVKRSRMGRALSRLISLDQGKGRVVPGEVLNNYCPIMKTSMSSLFVLSFARSRIDSSSLDLPIDFSAKKCTGTSQHLTAILNGTMALYYSSQCQAALNDNGT